MDDLESSLIGRRLNLTTELVNLLVFLRTLTTRSTYIIRFRVELYHMAERHWVDGQMYQKQDRYILTFTDPFLTLLQCEKLFCSLQMPELLRNLLK